MEKSAYLPLSRTRLESLSTGELIKLADSFGIDIPPGLERIFIIEELLECVNTIQQEEVKDDLEVIPSLSETAALPKHYNFSFVEVIIRDPLWVFVCWEVKGFDREIHENARDFNGYFLRVIPLTQNDKENLEDSFTLPIGVNESARYLGFAERTSQDPCRYIIKLGVIRGDTELQITASKPFNLPQVFDNENVNIMKNETLLCLSGVEDYCITASYDRRVRFEEAPLPYLRENNKKEF